MASSSTTTSATVSELRKVRAERVAGIRDYLKYHNVKESLSGLTDDDVKSKMEGLFHGVLVRVWGGKVELWLQSAEKISALLWGTGYNRVNPNEHYPMPSQGGPKRSLAWSAYHSEMFNIEDPPDIEIQIGRESPNT